MQLPRQRVEAQQFFGNVCGHSTRAREPFANPVKLGTDLRQRRSVCAANVKWGYLVGAECGDGNVHALLAGMTDTPDPALDVNLAEEPEAGLALGVPDHLAVGAEIAAQETDPLAGRGQRCAVEQSPARREIAHAHRQRRTADDEHACQEHVRAVLRAVVCRSLQLRISRARLQYRRTE